MKKAVLCSAILCSLLLMTTGCQKNNTESQSDTSSVGIVSYIGDEHIDDDIKDTSDTPGGTATSNNTATDTEKATDSDSETDSDTSSDTSNTSETDSEDSDEYPVSEELVESQLTGYEEEVAGTWNAKYILNSQQNEVDGAMIYGSAYNDYGGELILNSDGTFSVRMGAGSDDASTKGTYTYNGSGELNMLYYNDSSETFERCALNGEEAIAMTVDLFGDIYTVYFMR